MKKDTSALHPTSSISTPLSQKYTWLMMQFKRNTHSMASMNPTIRFPMNNFKDISIATSQPRSTTLRNRSCRKWRLWPLMPPKVYSLRSLRKIRWTTSKSSGLTSWSIRTSSHGWSKSTQTLAWSAAVLSLIESSRTCFNNHSSWVWT